jgi:ABC-type uncharacterized transport system substrate-binding protein
MKPSYSFARWWKSIWLDDVIDAVAIWPLAIDFANDHHPFFDPNVQLLAELALRHRLPAITLFPDFARAGGLLAYGPNLLSLYRLAGVLAGKVARGADPAALPIERPTKFETVLNMRTAHALGISISTSLLLRADEVIE